MQAAVVMGIPLAQVAICLPLLAGLGGTAALAQTPPSPTGRVVTLEYEFTVSGLRAFRARRAAATSSTANSARKA